MTSTTNVATSSLLAMRSDRYGCVKTKSKVNAATTAVAAPAMRPPMIAASNTGMTSTSAMSAFGRWSRQRYERARDDESAKGADRRPHRHAAVAGIARTMA